MEGLDPDGDMWLDATMYCNALEPLLRLDARDTDYFVCEADRLDGELRVRRPFRRHSYQSSDKIHMFAES